MGPTLRALLLVAPLAFAANAPRFTFTAYPSRAVVAVDAQGNTYLAGFTPGTAVVATPGAYQSQNNGGDTCPYGYGMGPPLSGPCNNSWIIKLNPSGAVVFATYLGGTGDTRALAIAVDSQENVYVAGIFNVGTGNFPVTPGAAFSTGETFIAKLNAAGSQLLYATLLPGTEVSSIVLVQDGSVLFTGTGDATFPATPGAYQTSFSQNSDGFQAVAGKLSPAGSSLTWATFISGDLGPATPVAISLDPAGKVLVAGTGGGATGDYADLSAFLYRLNPDGSNLLSSAVFGTGYVIAMNAAPTGDIYVACTATGPGFSSTIAGFGVPAPVPLTNGVIPNYLLHVAADGVTVLNSIYLPFFLPGSQGLDVDSAGDAYLAGTISGPPLVTATPGAFQSVYGGGPSDSVLAKIAPDGEILGTTYWAGSYDAAISMAAERDGSVVLVGVQYATPGSPGNFFAANLFPAVTLENSASFAANTVSPVELVSLQGYGIGPSTPGLSGVQVYFDNFQAPISYAQARQINAQAPWEIAGQTTTQVQIVYNGAQVGSVTVPVSAAQPGIFYVNNFDGSPNSPSNPARAGSSISIYGTGGGAMNPAGVTGASWPPNPLSSFTQPVSVSIAGEAATVLYAGSAPTLDSGYFQINVQLPADLTSAAQSLCVSVGGIRSAPAAISIR